jgi:hypothetical protein
VVSRATSTATTFSAQAASDDGENQPAERSDAARRATLKILQNFEAEEEFVLERWRYVHLPPRYAHDGAAATTDDTTAADCMTHLLAARLRGTNCLSVPSLRFPQCVDEQDGQDATPEQAKSSKLVHRPSSDATSCPAEVSPNAITGLCAEGVADMFGDPLALAQFREYRRSLKAMFV